jgi:hypothetical protein
VLGGSSRYLQLLSAKADECLGVQVRASLSSSEHSHGIHEIEGEEMNEDVAYDGNDWNGHVVFDHPILRGDRGVGFGGAFGPQPASDFNQHNDFEISNSILFSGSGTTDISTSAPDEITTPEWNSALESDATAFGGMLY